MKPVHPKAALRLAAAAPALAAPPAGAGPPPALVADINLRGDGIYSIGPYDLTNVNGTVYFGVFDGGKYGVELWKTNGTSSGTTLVKDVIPGPQGSFPDWVTNVNGTVYFTAQEIVDAG